MAEARSKLSRADEIELHSAIMGGCCHEAVSLLANEERTDFGFEQSIDVKCTRCDAETRIYAPSDDNDFDYLLDDEEPGRARRRGKPEIPAQFTVTQAEALERLRAWLPHYGGNEHLAKRILRRIEDFGWSPQLVSHDRKQVCVLTRGSQRFEGDACEIFSDAVYTAALKLARSGALRSGVTDPRA